MGKITVEEKSYGTWGKCVRISNGTVELYATVEIGPRIIRFGTIGGPNIFFENTERDIGKFESGMDFFGKGEKWYIYGGHRLWHAPEAFPRTYLPDNYPVKYEFTENGVRLIPNALKQIGTQNEMEISMDEDGGVNVIHKVTNIGAWDIKLAPWAISVLAHGGVEVVPLSDRDTDLLSNRNLILWPYTKIDDERVRWHDRYVMLETSSKPGGADGKNAFKFGTNNVDGYMMYFNNNNLFVKYFDYEDGAEYPDYGCNYETYTNTSFIECESLGKLQVLKPEETATHTERWKLFTDVAKPENTDDIENAVKKYIEK